MPRCAAALALIVSTVLLAAGPARAVTVDPGQVTGNTFAMDAVACPTVHQCTAVDNDGHAVTYSPVVPHRVHRITLGRCAACTDLVAIACPAVDQCTAGSQLGGTYTFAPRGRADIRHGGYGPVSAVSCASPTQCVLLDGSGHRRTFDPRTPDAATVTSPISAGVGLALACPTTGQCTNVGDGASTFDPRVPPATPPVAAPVLALGIAPTVGAISCPNRSQCTAVNFGGSASTFDPAAATRPARPRSLGHRYLTSVACPTARQCTAVDSGGTTLTFDPTRPRSHVRHRRPFKEGAAVDCPSAHLCSVVGGRFEVSFDPR